MINQPFVAARRGTRRKQLQVRFERSAGKGFAIEEKVSLSRKGFAIKKKVSLSRKRFRCQAGVKSKSVMKKKKKQKKKK